MARMGHLACVMSATGMRLTWHRLILEASELPVHDVVFYFLGSRKHLQQLRRAFWDTCNCLDDFYVMECLLSHLISWPS